jgi:chromosome partitioning protein
MLSRAIAVINGKGGVGKTSLTSNLSGLAAAADYRVLAVDLDPQGNLATDLGYRDDERNDRGRSMYAAVATGTPLQVIRGVRERLDVVAGGGLLKEMTGALYSRGYNTGQSTDREIHDAIAPIAGNYDLIMIDCPPGDETLQRMALAAAHYVLIPTKSDSASLDGLLAVGELFTKVRATSNPDLELLGVALFGIGVGSHRIAKDARDTVARDLGDPTLVFDARIRHVEGTAKNTRDLGRLAHELEAALVSGRHRADDSGPRLAASAPGLAEDYSALALELLTRLSARSTVPA